MILLTNGDSWTQGDSPAQTPNWKAKKTLDWYDIVPNFGNLYKYVDQDGTPIVTNNTRILYKFYDSPVWPKKLGELIGCETWNAGRLGDDNYTITQSTMQSCEWLKNQGKKPDYVIIGWTSMLRIPIYITENDELTVQQQRPDTYQLANDLYMKMNFIQTEFLFHIFNLQNYFKVNNIDYLFFNAFDKFEDYDEQYLSKFIDKTKWIDNDPKKAHFKEYICNKHGLDDWDESEYFRTQHPTDISHIEWAEYLNNYIKKL